MFCEEGVVAQFAQGSVTMIEVCVVYQFFSLFNHRHFFIWWYK